MTVGESIAAAALVRAVFGKLPLDRMGKRPYTDIELVEGAKLLLNGASKRLQMDFGQERLTTSRIRDDVWRRARK